MLVQNVLDEWGVDKDFREELYKRMHNKFLLYLPVNKIKKYI